MRWVLVVLCACGRIAFDARSDANTADAYTGCPIVTAGAGRQHTCAIDVRGQLWCWGYNEQGQVQPGGPREVVVPTQLVLAAQPVEVHGGRFFTCARVVDGNVSCWGEGGLGQRGDSTLANTGPPSRVALGGARAVALAVGGETACIIRESDRAVMCWGNGEFFQLGQPTMNLSPTPLLVAGTAGAKHLALGHRSACIIDSNDTATCWGRNNYGQLGNTDGMDRSTPIAVAGIGPAQLVSAGGRSSCALESTGEVRCWGRNQLGALGTGDFVELITASSPALSDATLVAANSYGACARKSDGSMACWGEVSPDLQGITPTARRARFTNVTAVYAGYYHFCALHDGALSCWGSNNSGQLGRGAMSSVMSPRDITLPGSVSGAALGNSFACAVVDAQAYCWGDNSFGQTGTGTLAPTLAPTRVPTGISVEGIAIGFEHTCAWGGGEVECWGRTGNGRLGIPDQPDVRELTPTRVAGLTGVTRVAAGSEFTCVITNSDVVCWGANGAGQLGNGTNVDSVPPVATGVTNATKLVAGGAHACALTASELRCWGNNNTGQLGIGTMMASNTPVTVAIPNGPATEIAAGDTNTCAINGGGELYCWGFNGQNELGLGDLMSRLVPTRVTLPAAAVGVAISKRGACARLATGQVYCWGDNLAGAVPGDRSPVPVHVAALDGASNLLRRPAMICIERAGTLACHGASVLAAADSETAMLDLLGVPAAIPPCP